MTQDKYSSEPYRGFSQNNEKKEKSELHKRAGATLASGGNLNWETPPTLFKQLNEEFQFVLDSAATDQNKLCKRYYTSKEDGLVQSWNVDGGGAVYCNPPYGRKIIEWVAKGATEAQTHNITVVMLIPAKPDIKLFHRYIWDKTKGQFRPNVEVRFIEGRLTFYLDGKRETKGPAAFPSMIVIFNGKNGKARASPNIPFTPRAEVEYKRIHEHSPEHLEPVSYVTLDEDGNITVRQLTNQTEQPDSLGDSN